MLLQWKFYTAGRLLVLMSRSVYLLDLNNFMDYGIMESLEVGLGPDGHCETSTSLTGNLKGMELVPLMALLILFNSLQLFITVRIYINV